jgi:hypothetical protein
LIVLSRGFNLDACLFVSLVCVSCFELVLISIEAKRPEKVIKIASERTGIDGKAEAEGWYQALIYASTEANDAASRNGNNNNNKNINNRPKSEKLLSFTNSLSSLSSKGRALTNATMSPLAKKMSVYGLNTKDGDSTIPMSICAIIIIILAITLHYLWYYKQWIGTKLYITLACLIVVLITIFFQEFIFISSDDHEQPHHHQHTNNNVGSKNEREKSIKAGNGNGTNNNQVTSNKTTIYSSDGEEYNTTDNQQSDSSSDEEDFDG